MTALDILVLFEAHQVTLIRTRFQRELHFIRKNVTFRAAIELSCYGTAFRPAEATQMVKSAFLALRLGQNRLAVSNPYCSIGWPVQK